MRTDKGSLGLNLMSESFAELFEESFASQQIKQGAIIKGTVVAVNDDVVIISAGLKSEAVIPIEQFQNEKGEVDVSVGDEFDVALDAVEDGFGETKLSREKAVRARTWTELEKAFEDGEVVSGVINGRVKGGFTVEIDNVRAFLPGSLVDVRPVRDPAYSKARAWNSRLSSLISVAITSLYRDEQWSSRNSAQSVSSCWKACRKATPSRAL